MEFNRNQYFMVGTVLLLLGIQFRFIDSVVLNEKSSRFIAQKMGNRTEATAAQVLNTTGLGAATPRKTIKPPQWIGWALIAGGAVLILHSLALRRPG